MKEKAKKIRGDILEILGIQVGAIPSEKSGNCYEIQPYWKGRLASQICQTIDKVRQETAAEVFGDILHLLETKWTYTEFAEMVAGGKEAGLVKKVIAKVIDGVKALKSKEGI